MSPTASCLSYRSISKRVQSPSNESPEHWRCGMETSWPRRPVIYEINTWVWLNELSQRYKHAMALGNVPMEQWDAIAALGVDAVWLMGVWERSPTGMRISNENADL